MSAKAPQAAATGVNGDATAARVAEVLIVGAGFAGLGTAIKLREAGVNDIVILDRANEIGGTWRDNTYPGAACDIPSHLYSFSFAPNPAWSRGYSGSEEIFDYIDYLVDRYGLRELIRFKHNVTGLKYDDGRGIWTINIAGRRNVYARSVVMAAGPLADPAWPTITGLENFAGHTIHSARWDHDYDFTGKRVAVIGTGASAVQIVPELVDRVARLKVFQRTPPWVLPRADYDAPEWNKALFRRLPASQSVMRKALFAVHESMALGLIWNTPMTRLLEAVGTAFMRYQVKDRWLRRQLTPQYRIGCKRVLISNDYYPALARDNCKLLTWPIDKITANGIRTAEGIEHQFDCIVCATGYAVAKYGTPIPITGRDGRVLGDEWSRGPQAYKSVSVAGYPNMFFTFGPNSGPGHNSALVYMEAQIGYIVRAVRTLLDYDLKALDVREDAQARYNENIQKRLAKTNWNSGCASWYLTDEGFNPTMYPGFATQYQRQMAKFVNADYRALKASGIAE